ncbi:Delta(3,5)-Delta(2,4)-dienoyl-CoA isomerase, mitochondrial [Hypsizygus marmoreus]|uniref:Delta(3,5)-Delta(2,4)-dienoyl-CoA isomerase, mitochondrial n=1 Tax=Hypsizygus marmoreus TaxID=39966 RepID=A0A369JGV0_HYPMA|nr:Delta(3,5)-Delta(2,4)-dienoyl-CoA isomerase, mitochondrial [Hypsizygus marmoreus]
MSDFSTQWLKVSEPFPHVFHVELARSPVNAFSSDYWRQYGKLFDALREAHESGTDIRAVVISSAFPKLFTAGLDLTSASSLGSSAADTSQDAARASLSMRGVLLEFQHAIGAPERCAFPVIVAVHGPVVGLGVDLISACDIRYAASNAAFSIKEVDIGLAPDVGTLAYITKITSNMSLAREFTYTGRFFSSAEAEKLGLVSKVVEGGRDEVVKAALELGKVIASKSPVAVAGAKHLITHSRDHTVAENLLYTGAWNGAALMTNDILENLRATKTKGVPKFAPLGIKSKL